MQTEALVQEPAACAPPSQGGDDDRPPDTLRILVLAACPFPANHGTPGSIREMAESVADLGHEVHVVTYHFGEDIPVRGPRLHRIPKLLPERAIRVGPTTRRPLYDLLMVFKAIQVAWRHRPQLIHAHGYEAGLAAWLCRFVTRLPVLYSGHNTMSDELPSYGFIRPRFLAERLARLLDWFVPRTADRCLPHSENIHRFLVDQGLADRTEPVVNFGINMDEITPSDGSDIRRQYGLGGPVILYAGVMDEFQRLDLLLQAMTRVVRQEPAARLLLVVTIPSEKHSQRLCRQIDELGLSPYVVWTKPQDLTGVRRCLAACDVAVVPRPGAPGFPIKLLNYMLARRPVVMFASSASGLVDGKHAILVSPDTGDAFAAAILRLLGDRDLCHRLAAGGYAFVRDRHDRRAVARQVCDVYRRLLARRAGRRGHAASVTAATPDGVTSLTP